MMARDRDDFDPRYSRYPMTFSDAVAALFRPRSKKVQAAADPGTIEPGGLELIGARAPAGESAEAEELSPADTTHAA